MTTATQPKKPDYIELLPSQQDRLMDLLRDMAWTKSDPWDNCPEAYQARLADGWRERALDLLEEIGVRYHDSNGIR